MGLPDSSILTNMQVSGSCRPGDILFEKKYITVREIENRLYTDEELLKLPVIASSHAHYREWQVRKHSCKRMISYVRALNKNTHFLEVGCGNGWLSHRLAEVPGTRVTGVDINFTELQQAARVFSEASNLVFIHGDIRSGILGDRQFDGIVFAASIQYFSSLEKIIHFALSYLKRAGEIHILDTAFYRPGEIAMARRRTDAYYAALGYPEMGDCYFHHSLEALHSFKHSVLYNPHGMLNRFLRKKDPFPWIRIIK
jgi:ubiquinone/menaquinone biosynthesis C-methylase UbiE